MRLPHSCILLLCCTIITSAYTSLPFVQRQDILGIWKITHPKQQDMEIVVRLNDDGTFDPYLPESESGAAATNCPEELQLVLGRGGKWEYDDETLTLAAGRPSNGKKVDHDTVLQGRLVVHVSDCIEDVRNTETDVHLSVPRGKVSIGKYMYPPKHKAFFEEPMLFAKSYIGSFAMNQILGNLNARLAQPPPPPPPVAKYHKTDFYNRTFYLTATPHPISQAYAASDKHYKEEETLHDISVYPITFFPNNTFTATGNEKLLRGRYGLTGEHRDRLWLQVHLFGAGRSAPGSVFSEGRLVSHDDRKGYVGNIQEFVDKMNQTRFFVEGDYYYGTDLKRAWKPNSMGTFALQEIDALEEEDDEEEDEYDEYDEIDNLRRSLDMGWEEGSMDAFQ